MTMGAVFAACGEGRWEAATRASGLGMYVCESYDPFLGPESRETEVGSTREEARAAALEECFTNTGHVCVLERCYDDVTHAEGGDSGWACREGDSTGRTWVRSGRTRREAEQGALEDCEADAGVKCVLRGCFDTSEAAPF